MKARTILVVVLIGMCGCASHRYARAMSDARDYWDSVNTPGEIESSNIAHLMLPFFCDPGIRYLTMKLSLNGHNESETATLLLVPIYQTLIDNGPSADALRSLIERSDYQNKVLYYSINGHNAAIRGYLTMAANILADCNAPTNSLTPGSSNDEAN